MIVALSTTLDEAAHVYTEPTLVTEQQKINFNSDVRVFCTFSIQLLDRRN